MKFSTRVLASYVGSNIICLRIVGLLANNKFCARAVPITWCCMGVLSCIMDRKDYLGLLSLLLNITRALPSSKIKDYRLAAIAEAFLLNPVRMDYCE